MPRRPKTDAIVERMKETFQAANGAPAPPPPPALSHPGEALRPGQLTSSYHYPAGNLLPPADSREATTSVVFNNSQSIADSSERITSNLQRALSTNERTNITGHATVQALGEQKEVIQHSLETVRVTRSELGEARQNIRGLRWGVYQEYMWKIAVVVLLFSLLVLEVYLKFIR